MPVAWWVLAALFALSMLLAFGLHLGPWWGVGTALASLAVAVALFVAAGVQITVDSAWLRVGRAQIELRYLAGVVPLDADEARRRRGPQADARAFLTLRPYIATAVEITLDDADDPTPYWLVATRRPRALSAALTDAVAAAPSAPSASS